MTALSNIRATLLRSEEVLITHYPIERSIKVAENVSG